LQSIEAQRPNIVKQGRLLPQQAASLRASTLQMVTDAGYDMSNIPAPVTGFLENWIDAVLARMELEVEHDRVSLELAAKRLAVKSATEDVKNAGQQSRIATLLGNWALRDLDGEAIRDNGRLVADALLNEMYPVILLRDRALFVKLTSESEFK